MAPRAAAAAFTLVLMVIDSSKPFTRAAGLRSGLTVRDLTGTGFRRLLHGVYIGAQVRPTVAVRTRAALLVSTPGSYASHHTAATLWGGWAPLTTSIHLSTPADGSRSERGGIASHRARPGVRPVRRAGVPVTPPVDAFLDLAATGCDLIDLVSVGDSLVGAEVVSVEELVEASARFRGAGCRRARRAARYVRANVDSVTETRLRMLVVLAGLPEPEVCHGRQLAVPPRSLLPRAADRDRVRRAAACREHRSVEARHPTTRGAREPWLAHHRDHGRRHLRRSVGHPGPHSSGAGRPRRDSRPPPSGR